MSSQVSALKLFDLIQSHRVTAVIYVAARLGIAELLRDGPQTLGKLAKATSADERALGRLLTALSTIGICSRTAEDCYALTEMGACRRRSGAIVQGLGHPGSRNAFKILGRNA
jgi:hypothetical protein